MKDRLIDSIISVNERKASVLIILLVIGFFFVLFCYWREGEVSGEITGLITTLIYAVAGVNIADGLSNVMTGRKEHAALKERQEGEMSNNEQRDTERQEPYL